MQILQLSSFPIEQQPLEALDERLAAWFATLSYPVRLLASSRSFDLRAPLARLQRAQRDLSMLQAAVMPLLQAVDAAAQGDPAANPLAVVRTLPVQTVAELTALVAGVPALRDLLTAETFAPADLPRWQDLAATLEGLLWRLPWLKDQARFTEELGRRHLRSASYVLITWEPPQITAQALVGQLQQVTGRAVTVLSQLPAVIASAYRPQAQILQPVQPGAPWLTGALSYDIQGQIDATTLHALLAEPYDVTLAIDLTTLRREQAQRAAELAYNGARILALDTQLVDTRAIGVRDSAQRVMQELPFQSLHTAQLAMLVSGSSEAEVEEHYSVLEKRLSTQVRWFRPPYQQGNILKFFSTTPRQQIETAQRPRSILSQGVGCLAGVLGYHRASTTEGTFWGIDAVRRGGLFFDLFASNQAAHMTILGMTGYGKTVFLDLITFRPAITQGYRVIGIDDFDNGPRMASVADAGGACYMLSMDTPTNILDVVYDEDAEGGWLANQVQHVIAQLSLLLGKPGKTVDGKDYLIARDFEPEETGLLDRALGHLYAGVTPATPLAQMPLLSDLIAILEGLREAEAKRLARTLRIKLFGTEDPDETALTTVGRCFNRPTEVDWRFGADITYYNTRNVPQIYRPFFYLQIIGAILRYMRDPRRDRRRRTLLAIDEFGYVTQLDALARLAANITKVARKYGIGLIAIDQNPLTFLESENGRYIYENSVAKVAFRLDPLPAQQFAASVRGMTEAHIQRLTEFLPGQCIAVVRNDIYIINVEASPRELRAFSGL